MKPGSATNSGQLQHSSGETNNFSKSAASMQRIQSSMTFSKKTNSKNEEEDLQMCGNVSMRLME